MNNSEQMASEQRRKLTEQSERIPAPTIIMLAASAQSMLASARDNMAHHSADLTNTDCQPLMRVAEEQADSLWRNLAQIAQMLTDRRSTDFEDLRAKIALWRRLAPESTFDDGEQMPDEALLCSIIDDIERMTA